MSLVSLAVAKFSEKIRKIGQRLISIADNLVKVQAGAERVRQTRQESKLKPEQKPEPTPDQKSKGTM